MNPSNNAEKPRVTARDFFLWLGGMVGLYVSTITFVLLAHQYIALWFPDPSLEPYGSFASGPIRIAVAFLVVFFPLYVWLMRVLHEDLRKNPEKRDLWVRRWLIYLTLFVAGIALAIDLVMTLNTFLNGELTARFGLKALSIFVVIGFAFWYYLEELKGAWEANTRRSFAVAGAVSVLVAASVIGAFFVIGSPVSERLYRIDDQKVNDLANIQSQVVSFWQRKQKLPAALSELADPLSGFSVPSDPDTGTPYAYRVTGKLSFELCATFNKTNRPTPASGASRPVTPYGEENWQHEAGQTCFERTIDPDLYPPLEKTAPRIP